MGYSMYEIVYKFKRGLTKDEVDVIEGIFEMNCENEFCITYEDIEMAELEEPEFKELWEYLKHEIDEHEGDFVFKIV